jgi:hypothetical protein
MINILKEAHESEHILSFTEESCDKASQYLQENIDSTHLEVDLDGDVVVNEICYLSVRDIYHLVEATKLLVQVTHD